MNWTLHPAADFPRHAAAWRALNAATVASPLLEPEFVAPLLAHFGAGNERLAICSRGAEVIAMALLQPEGRLGWTTFQPSQAPVGLWLQRRDAALAELLAALARALPGPNLVLSVLQRDPDLERRPADTASLATMDYIQTGRVTLCGSFDEYWAGRGKNLRSNLKKQRARLEREGTATRMDVVRDAAGVAAAIAQYARLEGSGWKAACGTAVAADAPQGRFYRELFESWCALERGAIYRYWFNEQLVAMDLCIEGNGMFIVLKTAYDAQVPAVYSPTLLMREEEFRAVFADGRTRVIEFYGKVMEWHLRWTDEIRTMYHVTAYRWPAVRLLKQRVDGARLWWRGRRPESD